MKRSVFLILLVTAQVCSQQVSFKGTLLDSKTKKPVVYANISFLETTKGISSTENGSFQMYINQKYMKGKVHVSCLNYKDTIVNALELNNTVLLLQPKQHELDEVVLTKRVNRFFLQDKVKKKVHGVHSVGMRMIAKYFPNDKKNRYCNYLSKVTIYFSKRHNKKSKFRVRVFNRDDKTGLPKEDLLNVNLPIAIKEKQLEVIVDLSLYDIEMPKNGLFIAFEKLFIPFNEYGKKQTASENDVFYAPVIGFTQYRHKKPKERTYYYIKGFWSKSAFNQVSGFKKYAPAMSLSLTN
ncbi:MAG: carboxypeptidase-like regulatory domain-containing protein [Flavobacteriaceae bacterium]|nr:carboxypeptidase-like regulatory domain-containing protein [Flavobacteriaceae bacterium]